MCGFCVLYPSPQPELQWSAGATQNTNFNIFGKRKPSGGFATKIWWGRVEQSGMGRGGVGLGGLGWVGMGWDGVGRDGGTGVRSKLSGTQEDL